MRIAVLRYALLGGTWLFLVAIIVQQWLVQDVEPSIWLLVLLAVISLVPLAARLRIGNWLDFTKKVDTLTGEVNTAKEQIRDLQIALVSKQSQQQWNVFLSGAESAKAFAEILL